jgi:hypothetical protein
LILPIGPANALLLADPVHGMMPVVRSGVMAMMQQRRGTPPASGVSHLAIPLKHLKISPPTFPNLTKP